VLPLAGFSKITADSGSAVIFVESKEPKSIPSTSILKLYLDFLNNATTATTREKNFNMMDRISNAFMFTPFSRGTHV